MSERFVQEFWAIEDEDEASNTGYGGEMELYPTDSPIPFLYGSRKQARGCLLVLKKTNHLTDKARVVKVELKFQSIENRLIRIR